MIRINLLPVRASKKKETARQQLVIAAVSVVAFLAVIGFVYSSQLIKIRTTTRDIATSEQELQRLKTVIGEIDNIKKLQEDVKKKLAILNRLRQEKTGPAIRLAKLSEAIPEKLWLTRYGESGPNISLAGIAFNEDIIAEFLRNLTASNEFTNVELLVSEQIELDGVKAKKFDVTCALSSAKKEEPAAKPLK